MLTSKFWIGGAYEVLPYFNGASPLEDVNANGSFCKASGILAKEVIHNFGVGLHVKLHLSFLHDFEACFENTWFNVKAVLESVILDDGDGASPRQ